MHAPQKDSETAGSSRSALAFALATSAVVIGFLAWSYHSSLANLINYWQHDSNYSHGWLIVPIAGFILWQRRDELGAGMIKARFWNFLPLIGLLAARYWLYERNEQWVEGATIPLVVGAIVFAVGGWGLFRWALPGVVYLLFMIPLPPRFNDLLAGPLQMLATIGSVTVLRAIGQPVLSEGNVIWVGTQRLEVAEACRGLSMLLSFVALITAMVILVRRPLWQRILLLVSTIPIALLCNIIRIAVTAVLYKQFNRPVETVHDWAGLGMMVLALALVALELLIMDWLVIEEEPVETQTLLRASYGPNAGPR